MEDIYKVFLRATYVMGLFRRIYRELTSYRTKMWKVFLTRKLKKHFILGAEEFPGPVNWTRPYFDCGR
jgi:hypothetical protein